MSNSAKTDGVTRTSEGSSDRFFGLVFTVFSLIVAVWPMLHSKSFRPLGFVAAGIFLTLALTVPVLLAPLNRLWTKFGLLLHRITSPIILGIMFFGVITPIGLLMRLAGKDLLRTKFDINADSYWIKREPPGPEKTSLKQQF
jgi:hypothetical protein